MTTQTSQERRACALQRFEADPNVPVLIIGGGINGAGTFRDLERDAQAIGD